MMSEENSEHKVFFFFEIKLYDLFFYDKTLQSFEFWFLYFVEGEKMTNVIKISSSLEN